MINENMQTAYYKPLKMIVPKYYKTNIKSKKKKNLGIFSSKLGKKTLFSIGNGADKRL